MNHTRQVDTASYVGMLKELIEEGHQVTMTISGSSMAPFLISARDQVILQKPRKEPRPGDIVFFTRDTGQYVLHRIHHIGKDGYYIIGDNQTQMEGPVAKEAVFAVVVAVIRKGIRYEKGDFWWWFFAQFWRRNIWLRRKMMRRK